MEPDVHWSLADEVVAYEIEYRLRAEAGDEASPAYTLHGRYLALYSVAEGAPISEEAWDAFGHISVLFSTYPYFRELVSSMTGRAGLPPLTPGVIRSPLDSASYGRHAAGEEA